MRANSLRNISILTALLIGAGFGLVFFYAPLDADQGFIQKIFYLHVPLAIVALAGFVVGGYHAIRHLRTGDAIHDARSYVAIHTSVIFGVAVLLTGAIWAKASWGIWWEWREPTLVSFLIVFLLYATYYPLRYAIPDRDRQARYSSVFAITAGAFVPLNFIAVRAATRPLLTLGVLLVVVGIQFVSLGLISELITSQHEERISERERTERMVEEVLR
jgi:heme exporter protein C